MEKETPLQEELGVLFKALEWRALHQPAGLAWLEAVCREFSQSGCPIPIPSAPLSPPKPHILQQAGQGGCGAG